MATVIDSLIIELGLDPKKLTQGQKEAVESFRRTEKEAKDRSEEIEKLAGRVTQAFGTMQRAILGVGALIGIRAGFRQLATEITQSDASLGRFAYTMNTTTEKVSQWRGATVLAGGTAEGFDQTIRGLSNDLQNFALNGVSSTIGYFRFLNINVGDANGKMRDTMDILRDLAKRMEGMDPARATAMLRQLGIDDGTISLLLRGADAVDKLVEAARQSSTVTKESSENAAELVKQWSLMNASGMNLARTVLNYLSPALLDLMKSTRGWFDELARGEIISKDSLIYKMWKGDKSMVQVFKEHDWGRGRLKNIGKDDISASIDKNAAGTGAFANNTQKEAFIRAEARRRGIDENVAMTVAKNEGFFTFASTIPGERSYGAFQLNYSKNPNRPSLGDRFTRETGLDAADPKNEPETIKYALDEARKQGWSQWYGWKGDRWAGIPTGGSGMAAANNDNRKTSTSTQETRIGNINVYTQATDANGIARDIKGSIERNSFATQAQAGPS